MKKVILGLIIGFFLGYNMGYRHGSNGEPSLWRRTLDKFGASRMAQETERQDRMIDSVSRTR